MAAEVMAEAKAMPGIIADAERKLYTKKFKVMNEVQQIHASLADVHARASVSVDRGCDLTERLAQYSCELQNIEKQIVALTRLRLVASLDDLVEALSEILSALIGCESFALFANTVIKANCIAAIGLNSEQLADCIASATREALVPPNSSEGLPFRVALNAEGHPCGALVLYRLLPQRTGLDSSDAEVFSTISEVAGFLLHNLMHEEQ